ncbi:tryptophan transporter [Clostridium neuense]|uniref:Tryptophan transporter n=1 Tax=Clostridium neuense TaxID=1728934 RepID=A0ABW8TH42_9CLOT
MNIKKIVINSLLLAIGAILHQITPPLVLGMKPDFYLALLFIIIVLNDDYKTCLCCGIVAGILSAVSTTFPGGQLPNIIDKFVTTNIIFLILIPFRKILNNQIKVIAITAIGTLISGFVFLSSAAIMVGLPGSFKVLFLSIVIPACAINTAASVVLFNAIKIAIRGRNLA